MFLVGEFSRIARVSARLLRYYDRIGLFCPARVEGTTGYRYYTASQLPRLNRILALKELGLSLDQIAPLVDEAVSADEIRGMLLLRRADAEQAVRDELRRLRLIESRIAQVDRDGRLGADVVMKSIPARRAVTIRAAHLDAPRIVARVGELVECVPPLLGEEALGSFVVLVHGEAFEPDDMDAEVGFLLENDVPRDVTLADGAILARTILPALETAATIVRIGPPDEAHSLTAEIGQWLEVQGYRLAGPNREVFLETPNVERLSQSVVEMQFPVVKTTEGEGT